MSHTTTTAVQTQFKDEREHRRQLAFAINRVLDGKTNNVGEVTLATSSATSTVEDLRTGDESVVFFMPTTANAATELAAGGMYVSAQDALNGNFTITHANNAQADRTFRYVIVG